MKKAAVYLLIPAMALALMGCAGEPSLPAETTAPVETLADPNAEPLAQIQEMLFPELPDPHYDAVGALALAEPLAQAGDPRAMYYMGKIYENQYGFYEIPQDMEQAVRWFEQGAALGNTACMHALGQMTMFEIGNQEARENALYWLQKGAELGDSECMVGLGYLAGQDGDYEKAVSWYQQAADAGGTEYLIPLGGVYESMGDYEAAAECYQKMLDRGDLRGMRRFGIMYIQQGDFEKAMEWLEKGAEAGDTLCMLDLGHLYEHGHHAGGPAVDKERAAYWYGRAEAEK